MKKMYLLYAAVVLGILCGCIVIAGGSLTYFWDPPSLLFVPVAPVLLMLTHFSPREMADAFRAAGTEETDQETLRKALLFFRTCRRLLILFGVIGFMFGFIMILMVLSTPGFQEHFGLYLGVGLLTLLYALCLVSIVVIPFESALEKKMR